MRLSRLISISVLSSTLAACMTVPAYMTDALTPNDIVQNLRCQLAEAVTAGPDPHYWLEDFKASFTITLKVFNENKTTTDGSLAIPLNPGVATPKIALGLTTRATRTIDFNINDEIKSLIDRPPCVNDGRLLTGNLGMRGYLDRIKPVKADLISVHKLKNSNYSLEFYIEKSLTPSSAFTMIPVGFRTLGANILTAAQAQYTHSLKLTITPPDPPKKEADPIRVVIAGYDTGVQKRFRDQLSISNETLNRLTRDLDAALSDRSIMGKDGQDVQAARIRRLQDEIKRLQERNKKIIEDLGRTPSTTVRPSARPLISPSEDQRLRDGQNRAILNEIEDRLNALQRLP